MYFYLLSSFRLVVQVVSDHWCSYRTWRIEICGDSDKDIPKFMTVAQQYNLERLQLEFDMFFMRATNQILSSHRYCVPFYKIP